MSERSYIELKQPEISEENLRREVSRAIGNTCHDLIKQFAFYDEDDTTVYLQAAEWNEDGTELISLGLEDEVGEPLSTKRFEEHPENIRYLCVPKVSLIYYPSTEEAITIATIQPIGGPDNTSVVRDFNGNSLSAEELIALQNDLSRYRELLKQGKTERSRTS